MLQHPIVRYGQSAELSVELPDEQLVARCGTPRGAPLDDAVAAVAAALVDPLDYPSLTEATVPGDRIALAVHRSVPQKRWVLAGILQTLAAADLQLGDIDIVLAPGSHRDTSLTEAIPEALSDCTKITIHDPEAAEEFAYLATTRDGKPVHINRRLVDADLVITVGSIRSMGSCEYGQAHGGVFPVFADAEMRNRFLAPATGLDSRENHLRCREADEVAWLLGARFTVQLIPGAGDEILQVLAGDVDSVIERGKALSKRVWECPINGAADVVVAAIEGGPDQQTWESVARAVDAAAQVVNEDGAILVASELDEPLGPALSQLLSGRDPQDTADIVNGLTSHDAESTALILKAMQRAHLYLLSQLDAPLVEELGMVPVAAAHEVANLCRRHGNCILLSNSQHARPSVVSRTMPASSR